jgi:phosphatidylglycerophosphate synthase
MTVTGVGAAGVLLWPSWWSVLICHLLLELQILFDCSDGEIARARGTTSPAGVYLDRIGHYLTEGLLPLAVGIHVDGGLDHTSGWTTLGALTSVVVLWNKCFGDLIHVARTYARLPLMSEDASLAAVRVGLLRRIRASLRAFPFFRSFVAFEFSLITLGFAVIDRIVGSHDWLQGWAIAMLPLAVLLAAGHLFAILLSRRLSD